MTREDAKTGEALTAAQFGAHAQAYVASPVHSRGADLERLGELAERLEPRRALDLGTGGGHVAYRLARAAQQVTAVDLSAEMLAAVAAEAAARGLHNIATAQASAERLPFPDAHFDLLASRYSAHHWRDAATGLKEARRVLRKGAPAIFIDIVAPQEPLFDTHLQAVELLRDVSHVRDYNLAEWRSMLAEAGFAPPVASVWRLKMEFVDWTQRIGAPAPLVAAIRILQQQADEATRARFGIEADGGFWLDAAMLETSAV